MKRVLFIMFILIAFTFAYACNEADDDDDDNDNDNADDDDTEGDDDTSVDDDTSDDDTGDDDSIDDDTDIDHAPVITESYWEPDPPEYGEVESFGLVWYTYMVFFVCDEDNDLLPDGNLVWVLGEPFEPEYHPLTDFQDPPETDLSNAGDCLHPVELSIIYTMLEEPPSGEHCADFYVEDSAGNQSDVFSPCFTMP